MSPVSYDLAIPESVLVIVAHPDDAEFQCGASLGKWASAGTVVHHVVCTDGSKGSWDPFCDQIELINTRQAEQRSAAAALGAKGEVLFLDYSDGELESGLAERSRVAYEIRRLRPTLLLGHDPWKRYRIHPDHRHAGLLAVEGAFAARDPFFFPEHNLAAHRPQALLLFEADEPNHAEFVDVSAADKKITALLAHKSQFISTHGITDENDPTQIAEFSNRIKHDLAASARKAGLTPSAKTGPLAAELFHAVALD